MCRRAYAAGVGALPAPSGSLPAMARSSQLARSSRLARVRHGAEIVVDAAQQVDQDLLLLVFQARQQPAFALERGNDHLVMGSATLRRQRDGVAAAVVRIG